MKTENALSARRHFRFLDALRGWAVVGVVFVHAFHDTGVSFSFFIDALLEQSARGVQLFYWVSAFSLAHSLGMQGSPVPYLAFFKRRFWRIAPLFYAALLYYLWQDGLDGRYFTGERPLGAWEVALTFCFAHGFSPFAFSGIFSGAWSISVEACFYALLPFVFFQLHTEKKIFTAWALSLAAWLPIIWALNAWAPVGPVHLWEDFLFFSFPSQWPVFLMGLWVYARACQSKDKRDKRGYRKLFIAALLYALIANMAGLPWLHLAAGCFISFFGERLSDMENTGKPQHMIFSLWVNTVLCRLGIISYGVYVGHFAVRHFLEVSGLGQSVRQWAGGGAIGLLSHFIILLLLSGLLAEVLHRGIEKPILKWVKKWGKQDKQVVSL